MTDDRSPGFRQRVRYRLDNLLARGTWAVLVWLGVVTFLTIVFAAVVLTVFGVSYTGDEDAPWFEDLWQTLLRVIDPGTMAGDVGWGRRLLALAVTVFGILVAGTLIGVIAAGVEDRVDRMRRGRSTVIEHDHVVVLGAGDHLPFVIGELVHAPPGDRPEVVVVLADDDPADLHTAISAVVDDLNGVRLVVRSGDPTRPSDLALVRLDVARSVIVLGNEDDSRWSVRAALAVAATTDGSLPADTVVDVADGATAERLVEALGERLHPLVGHNAVARIAAFALRQPGLVAVVDELIDAPRSGIRVGEPGLTGAATFAELVAGMRQGRPIGRITVDGTIHLSPAHDQPLRPDDRLVFIGTNDDVSRADRPVPRWGTSPVDGEALAGHSANVVVAGWSRVGEMMLGEWLADTGAASTLTIIGEPHGAAAGFVAARDDARVGLVGTAGEAIERLGDGSDGIVVLLAGTGAGSTKGLSARDVDAETLLTAAGIGRRFTGLAHRPRVVVELLDPDSAELAAPEGPDDFVISDALASKFLVQLAIEPLRRNILLSLYDRARPDLVTVDGATLELAGRMSMADIVDRACERGMLAIGWRDGSTGELMLAPPLTATVDWTEHHRLVAVR